MDRLEAMSILIEAVESGSLSAAGRQLGIPLATVSRKVSELENHLKTRLLLRGKRKLLLTDAGHSYVASCRRILEDISEAERAASGEYRAPQGELVISAPIVLGRLHVLPILAAFLRAYPEIRVRLLQTDRTVDLLEEQIDVAVRFGELPESSLIATRVGLLRQVLCASPTYLTARGTPNSPDELPDTDCITFEAVTVGNRWEFRRDGVEFSVGIPWRLVVNTADAAAAAAVAGIGIARVPSYLVHELVAAGELTMVLEQYEPKSVPLNLVYPSQRQLPLKLRAFLDFATPRLRERLAYKSQR
jgi:DNA-binding transcriptional LysR family regulator